MSLKSQIETLRVSSTLNRDSKSFGKQFLIDGDDETCWNSDQGPLQWVMLEFRSPVVPLEVSIMFQGGFAAKECTVMHMTPTKEDDGNSGSVQLWEESTKFYPKDGNGTQCEEFDGVSRCMQAPAVIPTGAAVRKYAHLADTSFPLDFPLQDAGTAKPVIGLKFLFTSSTDTYGRVIIYNLDVTGR
ncbi:Nuclear receptor 2C2-associated protein [Irineochytrium annulatum]|nr:Nuclear receptor 2C2-associated protein [Irineochytrium annulatum]